MLYIEGDRTDRDFMHLSFFSNSFTLQDHGGGVDRGVEKKIAPQNSSAMGCTYTTSRQALPRVAV